jgi:hypothetical protein
MDLPMLSVRRVRATADLLDLARALIPAARRELPGEPVASEADRAEAAAATLQAAHDRLMAASADREAQVEAVLAREGDLDRRVRALGRALGGAADLELPGAAALLQRLFPKGVALVVDPRGRAQATEYAALADRLAAHLDDPAGAHLKPATTALEADLRAFVQELDDKSAAVAAARAEGEEVRAAADALREALGLLDLACALAAGGRSGAAYQRWAAAAGGLR